MCGRASFTAQSVSAAAISLEAVGSSSSPAAATPSSSSYCDADSGSNKRPIISCGHDTIEKIEDNPNISPGNVATVFRRALPFKQSTIDATVTVEKSNPSVPIVECTPMIWGLLPQQGTSHRPHHLPHHPDFTASPHYKLFNARSETVYEKKSFANLILNGQTCLFSVEGYYEWTYNKPPPAGDKKAMLPRSLSGDKRKQPYFFHSKERTQQTTSRNKPLLLAGIWSSVRTGRHCANTHCNEAKDATTYNHDSSDELITTFAILTMDAHPKYSWIHDRQPVIIWDASMALEWLMNPSPDLLERIRNFSTYESRGHSNSLPLEAYPVTKKINNGTYRGQDCTWEVKLETVPSVKSFFAAGTSTKEDQKDSQATTDSREQRQLNLQPIPSPPKPSSTSSASKKMYDSTPVKTNVQSPSKSPLSKAIDSKKRKGGHSDIASFFKTAKKTPR